MNVYIDITKFFMGNLCFALGQDFGMSFYRYRYGNCSCFQ